MPATFMSPVITGGSVDPFLPADLDGSILPPAGAPKHLSSFPASYESKLHNLSFPCRFRDAGELDVSPLFASPAAAGFTALCPTTRSLRATIWSHYSNYLDGIGDRLMFRLAYRNFGTHESVVGNFTVSSGGVAGIRWFELRNVTADRSPFFSKALTNLIQPGDGWEARRWTSREIWRIGLQRFELDASIRRFAMRDD